jgi:hypothetical protein
MSFKPYHYEHIKDFILYYASSLGRPDIKNILENGISCYDDAKLFCEFIPVILDQRKTDEKLNSSTPVEIGTGVIQDLHYEAGAFVCDAGFESVWDEMIEGL